MISSIFGKLLRKENGYLIVDVSGFGLKVYVSKNPVPAAGGLPPIGGEIFLHTAFFIKKDAVELYGFLEQNELEVFGLLNCVSGVGPKTALGILDSVKSDKLLSAIQSNKPDIIVENSGIGRKKAEKIVLELRDKIKGQIISEAESFESDKDVVNALKSLGYKLKEVEEVMSKIPQNLKTVSERLKYCLKNINNR